MQNLKDLFAPKLCRIYGCSELRILKDLAAKARSRAWGVCKLLIILVFSFGYHRKNAEIVAADLQRAQKQKRLRRIGGVILYKNKHITFLKIVKRKIGWTTLGRAEPPSDLESALRLADRAQFWARRESK